MRLIIIDDDKMICFALRTILEVEGDIEIAGIGYSYEDAIRLYEEHKPDICLMDIRMGEKTGLDALRRIKEKHKDARIVLLTTFLDDEYIREALKLGGKGYLLKDEFENIVPALRAVMAGQNVYGNKVIEKIPFIGDFREESEGDKADWAEQLTEKEIEIMEKVAEGLNNKEIAMELFLSEGTVRNYVSTILDKLDLRDRTQIAIYYLRRGK